MTGTRPVPLRIDEAVLDRCDRVSQALSERAAGAKVSRADALRIAINRGLESLERELGLSRKKK
jgi:hypothetical protein